MGFIYCGILTKGLTEYVLTGGIVGRVENKEMVGCVKFLGLGFFWAWGVCYCFWFGSGKSNNLV